MADDIFKEVDEDLRAERRRAIARRLGAFVAAAALLILVGVGLWQFQAYRVRQQAAASAVSFFAAAELADSARLGDQAGAGLNAAGAKAAALFATVARKGPEGFRTLARFREAQLDWQGGQRARALDLWESIHDDASADATLRGAASLLWVQHQLGPGSPQMGNPQLLESRLGALSQPGGAWRPMAQELDAELDLRLGRIADAKRKLGELSEDGDAPQGLRELASGLNQTIENTDVKADEPARAATAKKGG